MDKNFKDDLEERLKFSHYVLYWCNRELEINQHLLDVKVREDFEKNELINIKKKLSYIYSKICFERREIFLVKKALIEFNNE